MQPILKLLAELAEGYILCYPNAGLPDATGEYSDGVLL
jgi:methionine synthase I (cobalamin-dependent)